MLRDRIDVGPGGSVSELAESVHGVAEVREDGPAARAEANVPIDPPTLAVREVCLDVGGHERARLLAAAWIRPHQALDELRHHRSLDPPPVPGIHGGDRPETVSPFSAGGAS